MFELWIWLAVFVISMIVLVKSSDYFTDTAEEIGIFLGIPPFMVGVTIVAIGTSLPELISSIMAMINNSPDIVVGNVVGSNIANIFLVLGIMAILSKKIILSYDLIGIDVPMLIGSAILLVIALWDGTFSFFETLVFLGGLVLYFAYNIASKREIARKESDKEGKRIRDLPFKTLFILTLSALMIYFGAKYTVESVVELSKILNIGIVIIASTAVAVGTSLPELAVTIMAIKKGTSEMAIGNILGSNVFNTFGVLGIAGLLGNVTVPPIIKLVGIPFMLAATIMYFFITLDNKITKWEGWLLILFYIMFIGYTLMSVGL